MPVEQVSSPAIDPFVAYVDRLRQERTAAGAQSALPQAYISPSVPQAYVNELAIDTSMTSEAPLQPDVPPQQPLMVVEQQQSAPVEVQNPQHEHIVMEQVVRPITPQGATPKASSILSSRFAAAAAKTTEPEDSLNEDNMYDSD